MLRRIGVGWRRRKSGRNEWRRRLNGETKATTRKPTSIAAHDQHIDGVADVTRKQLRRTDPGDGATRSMR
jgi:hypothetical protein